MRRVLAHIRFACNAARRLNRARRALRPRLPNRALRMRTSVVALALWARVASRHRIPVPALLLCAGGALRKVRVSDESEFFGSLEVFSTDDYNLPISAPVRRVLDLGANVGFSAILFAERYPEAEIVAVEAAPDTFLRLQANVSGLPSIRAVHRAVGSEDPVRIDLVLPSAERQPSANGVAVPGMSLTHLLEDLGWSRVDLMKIDIEGGELAVFADPAMRRVSAIVGEVHGGREPRALLPGYRVDVNPAVGSSAMMFRAVRA